MQRSRQRRLVGGALVIVLVGLAAGAARMSQGREHGARQLALQEAQSQLDTEVTAALDALGSVLADVPASALVGINAAPLASSRLRALGPNIDPLTINVELAQDGQLCLMAITPDERRVIASGVAPMFQGESPANFCDDNQNGVADESGLYFTLLNHTLDFGVTLSRPSAHGPITASGTRKWVLQENGAPR